MRDKTKPLLEKWNSTTASGYPRELQELFDDFWALGTARDRGALTPFVANALQRLVTYYFVDRLLQQQDHYPASHYKTKYGIPPARLRKAKQRGHLYAIVVREQPYYREADVKRLWPEDFQ